MELRERLLRQASFCADLGSPLYAGLMRAVADDLGHSEPDAITLELLQPWAADESPEGDVPGLRLLAAAHRLALLRMEPALGLYLPTCGGTAPGQPEELWPIMRQALGRHLPEVSAWMQSPPQTNEPGRSAALMFGLLEAMALVQGDRPIQLFEVGCSAGLNLRADRFGYKGLGGELLWPASDSGDVDEPKSEEPKSHGPKPELIIESAWARPPGLAVQGLAVPVRIERRVGFDLNPLDMSVQDDRMALSSYVWADQVERFRRLGAAIRVAQQTPVELVRSDAAAAVRGIQPVNGRLTVLWQSVMQQYLGESEPAFESAVEDLLDHATHRAPVARIAMEKPAERFDPVNQELTLTIEPHGFRRVIAHVPGHGTPVTPIDL